MVYEDGGKTGDGWRRRTHKWKLDAPAHSGAETPGPVVA